MKKRIIIIAVSIILIISSLCMSACSSKAPELDSVKDRYVYLIEESRKFNILFFGSGLPVYEREDGLSERRQVYYNDTLKNYNKVRENCRYMSLDDMKASAEKIYSSSYLKSLYETAFDGVLIDKGTYIRFYSDDDWMYQNVSATEFDISERIYDYSSMKIIDPSDSEYVNIEIDSYTPEKKSVQTVTLSFVYENGNWYLDSPTY